MKALSSEEGKPASGHHQGKKRKEKEKKEFAEIPPSDRLDIPHTCLETWREYHEQDFFKMLRNRLFFAFLFSAKAMKVAIAAAKKAPFSPPLFFGQ